MTSSVTVHPAAGGGGGGGGGGGATRIYTADFSTGDFSQVDGLQESSSSRITLVTPGLAGNLYAAKILVGPSDAGVAGSGGNWRTEINVQQFSPHLGGGSLQGKEVWVAFNFKIASPYYFPGAVWMDHCQFHAGSSPWSPVFAFQAHNDTSFIIEQRGGSSNTPSDTGTIIPVGGLQLDHEYQMIIDRLFSVGSDGFTKVWLDRDPALSPSVSLTGATLFSGLETLPYMKCGGYGNGDAEGLDNKIYFSNIRWATTAAGL